MTYACLYCAHPTESEPIVFTTFDGRHRITPPCCLACSQADEFLEHGFFTVGAGFVAFRSALGGFGIAHVSTQDVIARPEFGTHGTRADAEQIADELNRERP